MAVPMYVDTATCSKCGLCAAICPSQSIEQTQDQFPGRTAARASLCIECAQCMAVCPHAAISVGDLSYQRDLFSLDPSGEVPDYRTFFALAATRRSVRRFQDRPVPPELLEQVVAAMALAPMGFPPHKTAVTILGSRSAVAAMRPHLIEFFGKTLMGMKMPFVRGVIRRSAGPDGFATLVSHVVPLMAQRLPAMKATGGDEITWDAPAMILLHAGRTSASHVADANIALAYGLLAAHSLGLGATASALVPPAVNKTRALREMLRLPTDHEVVAGLFLGYPRHCYQRGIRRRLAGIDWM